MSDFDPAGEALALMCASTVFLVVDCETAKDAEGNDRIITVCVGKIVNGQYRKARGEEIYLRFNPGTPISKDETKVHGFTDASVKRFQKFGKRAKELYDALDIPNAVFVAANARFDINALRYAFQNEGLDIPTIPVMDVLRLPKTVGYTNPNLGNSPGLAKLCDLLDVTLANHHNAKADVRATAGVLLKLLAVGVRHEHVDLTELLVKHNRGTTTSLNVSKSTFYKGRLGSVTLPQAHLEAHTLLLPDEPTPTEIDAWIAHACQCASLMCPLLASECSEMHQHWKLLGHPLSAKIKELTKPGEVGTLLTGVVALMSASVKYRGEVQWWLDYYPDVDAAVRCGHTPETACPGCHAETGCFLDVVYEKVAAAAIVDKQGELNRDRYKELNKHGDKSMLASWCRRAPDLGAHALYLLAVWSRENGNQSASSAMLQLGIAYKVEDQDPALAVEVATAYVAQRRFQLAEDLLTRVLVHETTQMDYLSARLLLLRVQAYREQAAIVKPPMTHPRKGRPPGRVRPNPFSIADK